MTAGQTNSLVTALVIVILVAISLQVTGNWWCTLGLILVFPSIFSLVYTHEVCTNCELAVLRRYVIKEYKWWQALAIIFFASLTAILFIRIQDMEVLYLVPEILIFMPDASNRKYCPKCGKKEG